MNRDVATLSKFLFAGRAVFTITSTKTGASFTYKFAVPRDDRSGGEGPMFASLLTGPDNLSDYTYMGVVTGYNTRHVTVRPTRASKVAESAPSFVALKGFLANLTDERVEFRHEGRCGRCGRALTVPSSIDSGLGPECAGKI